MFSLINHVLAEQALQWACSSESTRIADEYACPTRDMFRGRLDSLIIRLRRKGMSEDRLALTDAVLSEIGNNAFDHNIGNWRDTPGIFFGADPSDPVVCVIADRGQGIRTTLSHVRTDIATDVQAMEIAFTERISGRAPERRGNGLKFVRHVLLSDGLDLWFGSGNAVYETVQQRERWNTNDLTIPGCCAILSSR